MQNFSLWSFFPQDARFSNPPELPGEIEACLKFKQRISPGLSRLWLTCFRAVRPFVMRSIWVSAITAICAVATTLIALEFLKPGQQPLTLLVISVAYFFTSILGQVSVFFNNKLRTRANFATQALLVHILSQKLLRISSAAAARQTHGNLKVLISSDTNHVAEFVDNFIRNFIPASIALMIALPLLVHLAGRAGLIGLWIMVLFLPISLFLNEISGIFQKKGQGALDSLASLLGEWVKNIRLVRYLSWDEEFEKEATSRLRRYMSFSTAQHIMACLIFGSSVSWWMIAICGVLVSSQRAHLSLDLVGFFGSLWLITFLAGYFTHIPNTIRLFGLAAPSMQRIAKILTAEEQQDLFKRPTGLEAAPKIGPTAAPKSVIFENVSFTYPNGFTPIQNLSVTIHLNQKIGIVGEIASGKTTFLKLLCGEYPPTAGRIWVEFEDGEMGDLWIKEYYEAYRKHLAWVPQEPFVSCDPISSNISLVSSAEESALVEAAYWAELEADITTFPLGIHEEVGEGGVNLSGGQRQRLNIARAYFSERPFLILDDILSALDPNTEIEIMKRLQERTTGFVLVTHRTSELFRLEQVFVMKNGTFIESGNPQVLASDHSTHFSRILKAYDRSYDPSSLSDLAETSDPSDLSEPSDCGDQHD